MSTYFEILAFMTFPILAIVIFYFAYKHYSRSLESIGQSKLHTVAKATFVGTLYVLLYIPVDALLFFGVLNIPCDGFCGFQYIAYGLGVGSISFLSLILFLVTKKHEGPKNDRPILNSDTFKNRKLVSLLLLAPILEIIKFLFFSGDAIARGISDKGIFGWFIAHLLFENLDAILLLLLGYLYLRHYSYEKIIGLPTLVIVFIYAFINVEDHDLFYAETMIGGTILLLLIILYLVFYLTTIYLIHKDMRHNS